MMCTAASVYATHVTRGPDLFAAAIALARRGVYIDTDSIEPDTSRWLPEYLNRGGPPDRFTFSSDAQTPGGSPRRLYDTFRACVRDRGLPLERGAAALRRQQRRRVVA